MSPARRDELSARFSRYFTLTAAEQDRTLDLLTASERESLRATIESFQPAKGNQATGAATPMFTPSIPASIRWRNVWAAPPDRVKRIAELP